MFEHPRHQPTNSRVSTRTTDEAKVESKDTTRENPNEQHIGVPESNDTPHNDRSTKTTKRVFAISKHLNDAVPYNNDRQRIVFATSRKMTSIVSSFYGWFAGDDPETTALVNHLVEKGVVKDLALIAVKKSPRLSDEGKPLLLKYLIDKGYKESDVVQSLLEAEGNHKGTLQVLQKKFVEPRVQKFEAAGTSKEDAEKALIIAKWDDEKARKYLKNHYRRELEKLNLEMEQRKLAIEKFQRVIGNLSGMKRKSRDEMDVSDTPRKRRRFNEDAKPKARHYSESDTDVDVLDKPETTKPEYHSSDDDRVAAKQPSSMASSSKKVAPMNRRRVVHAAPVTTSLTKADKMRLFDLMKKIPDEATAKSLYKDLHPIFEWYSTKKIDAVRVVAEVTALKQGIRGSGATALLEYVEKFPTLLGSVVTELKRKGSV
eukprot:scaffold296_cov102-Amphora_coffeaeformis.AAC.38